MNITFLTETTLERETSGATPVQDLLGNTGPLRLTLAVTAIGNTYSPPGPGLRRGRTVLEVSVEDSPDGVSGWKTLHTFRDHTYPDGDQFVCADCGHEWPATASAAADDNDADAVVKDANGTVLADGDAVVLIKDLKFKGSSTTLKQGTKVKSIRLVGGDHEVDCKMDAGNFMLKACFLRKA